MNTCIKCLKNIVAVIGLSMITFHVAADDQIQSCRTKVEALAGKSELSFFERQALTNLIRRNNHAGIQAQCQSQVGKSAM